MQIRLPWKLKNVVHDLLYLIYNDGNNKNKNCSLIYDSYAGLGFDNSERIVCQITSDAFRKIFFLFIRWSIVSSAQSNAWLNEVSVNHRS